MLCVDDLETWTSKCRWTGLTAHALATRMRRSVVASAGERTGELSGGALVQQQRRNSLGHGYLGTPAVRRMSTQLASVKAVEENDDDIEISRELFAMFLAPLRTEDIRSMADVCDPKVVVVGARGGIGPGSRRNSRAGEDGRGSMRRSSNGALGLGGDSSSGSGGRDGGASASGWPWTEADPDVAALFRRAGLSWIA